MQGKGAVLAAATDNEQFTVFHGCIPDNAFA
jgi:hypothetical protein